MTKKIADKGASEAFLRAHVNWQHDDCLLWPYSRKNRGYGLAVIDGKQSAASRWMCVLAHGEPPFPKAEAAHSCGNPACVNPRHLRWATRRENMADKLVHGTHNRGERSGKSSLTEADVLAIRVASGSAAQIGAAYGVSKACVYKIRNGLRWWYVP